MELDYKFIVDMFSRYSKHLQDVTTSIDTLVDSYDRQLNELHKLDTKKYGWRIKELEKKKAEAFKKLSHICPNIQKMNEQMNEIQKEFIIK